jgi:CRP/FNR family transcriptional regulator, nitrogen fixation regulation protein
MLHWKSDIDATRGTAFIALQGLPAASPAAHIAGLMSSCREFARDAEIFQQNETVSNIYAVVSGAVRFTRLLRDGRRQIGGFYLPGDLFGLESEERHSFSAESIVNSKIGITKRSTFVQAAMQSHTLAHQVWMTTASHLHRAQGHMSVLGRGTAQERIATFLLDMDARLNSLGSIDLPMPRRDIADYLGLTIETVSRVLRSLERARIISIPDARRITLLKRQVLCEMEDF